MKLLETWDVDHPTGSRRIELLHGDLARIPPEHAVDVLVVSAFPNDYVPTRGSLIGALDRAGLSVHALSRNKQVDLRQQFSCWLSKPVPGDFPFRHVLCIESGWRGNPPEITDDLFRALAPYLLTDLPNSSAAMPLIGTGDAGWDPEQMLEAILTSAVSWMQRGLPLRLLKIVVRGEQAAERARSMFAVMKAKQSPQAAALSLGGGDAAAYDIFVSYARPEAEMATYLVETLQAASSRIRIFFDQVNMREGTNWPQQVADALDHSKRVVALYSSHYWASRNCKSEFLAAFARQNDSGTDVLFPIYLSDADIPYMFRILQHADCRVGDRMKVAHACTRLIVELG